MAECKSCGEFVTDDYVRVFGDNDGNIFDCRNCRARSSRGDDDEDESGERVVLLREVTGTDAGDGTDESADAASGDGGASQPERVAATAAGDGGTAPSGSDDAAETGVTAGVSGTDSETARSGNGGNPTPNDGEETTDRIGATAESGEATGDSTDGETGSGARERLAGLFSSLRG